MLATAFTTTEFLVAFTAFGAMDVKLINTIILCAETAIIADPRTPDAGTAVITYRVVTSAESAYRTAVSCALVALRADPTAMIAKFYAIIASETIGTKNGTVNTSTAILTHVLITVNKALLALGTSHSLFNMTLKACMIVTGGAGTVTVVTAAAYLA